MSVKYVHDCVPNTRDMVFLMTNFTHQKTRNFKNSIIKDCERSERDEFFSHFLRLKHTFIFNSLSVYYIFVDTTVLVFVTLITSVTSFLVLGGGARPPNVPTEKSNLYARASEASERLRNIIGIQIDLHVQSMQFPFITYGMRLYR